MVNSILELKSMTLEFPGVLAVDNANLSVEKGEVRAIVGENGAGKSSLVKMLSGVYSHKEFEGEIKVEGESVEFNGVQDAENQGITMIPQELNLVEELTVAENLFLNQLPTRNGVVDKQALYSQSDKILKEIGVEVSAMTKVKELGVAQKQMIVIGRALWNKVKILILDEPTSTLSNLESDILFEKIKMLKESGVTCFYISHRLEEILDITDNVTVMRDGKIITTEKTENMNEQKIVSLMIGKDLGNYYPTSERVIKGEKFIVNNFNVYHKVLPGRKVVNNVNLSVKEGEILGLFGLVGAGRTELAMGIMGAWDSEVNGTIKINGKEIKIADPKDALIKGVSYLPEDRKTLANIPDRSVNDNISASCIDKLSKFGVINKKLEFSNTDKHIKDLSIRTASMHTKISTLSGGNQQKCILSRQISVGTDILILDEPTQGVDVGAKTEIYEILNELASEGKSILMISSDLLEVLGVSDRVLVMHEGNIVADLIPKETDREKVLEYATIGKSISKES